MQRDELVSIIEKAINCKLIKAEKNQLSFLNYAVRVDVLVKGEYGLPVLELINAFPTAKGDEMLKVLSPSFGLKSHYIMALDAAKVSAVLRIRQARKKRFEDILKILKEFGEWRIESHNVLELKDSYYRFKVIYSDWFDILRSAYVSKSTIGIPNAEPLDVSEFEKASKLLTKCLKSVEKKMSPPLGSCVFDPSKWE